MAVVATLNYLDPSVPEPTTYYVEPPEGVPVSTVGFDPHEVEIVDERTVDEPLTLERDGIVFVPLGVRVEDFDDAELVRARLYPALEAYARDLLHAEKAVVTDHAFRRRAAVGTLRSEGRQRTPLHMVHCDFTPEGVPNVLHRALGDEADELLPDARFLFLDFWWPLVGPLRDDPLAICEPATVAPEDLISIRHHYADGPGSVYGVSYNPAHRWHFMSDMQPDEAIAFVLYDNRVPTPWFTPHTAFALPDSGGAVPPRSSIEVRLAVVLNER